MAESFQRKKKRSLGSMLRESSLTRKFKQNQTDGVLNYDWSKINYNRSSVVNLLMSLGGNGDYLEIGCASNLLFDTVAARRKVGVDPAQGGTLRLTSDAFFAQNSETFDVIFIDGLHVYPQVRRDLVNAMAAVRKGGWIALHDMVPRDWIEEHVPQISTSRWTGDGWKVAFELMASPDVDFRLVAIDHGVGILRVLSDNPRLTDLEADLAPRRFRYFHENFARLPVVDWQGAREWIESYRA
jgi:hypothetical protein